MKKTLRILAAEEHRADGDPADPKVLRLPNDADPLTVAAELADGFAGIERIELHFPKFTDGRAYSQAFLLRRRLGFAGDIRATGEVLIDQLVQMQRTGFSSAVLREGLAAQDAQRQFDRFAAYYQGDAAQTAPRFARQDAASATPAASPA